jgi:hypothetical protein
MATYNINCVRGDTYNGVQFTIVKNAAPLDLTGAAIRAQIKKDSKSIPVKTLSLGAGISIINAAQGIFQIGPFLADIPAGTYRYDVQITIGSVVKTYISGTFIANEDQTN